jgi:coenzyme PQQ precursor peptide PqqA
MVMSRVSACAAAALSANQTGANHVTHDRLRNLDHLLRDEHPRPLRGFKQPSLALVHARRKAGSLTEASIAPVAGPRALPYDERRSGERAMTWETPVLTEIAVGLEVTSYSSGEDEFLG